MRFKHGVQSGEFTTVLTTMKTIFTDMSADKTIKHKVIVLAIDMDGCFACDFFYPALKEGREDCVGLVIKLLKNNDVDNCKKVIVRPATARKDDISDRLNANHYQTPLTSEVLFSIAAIIRDHLQGYEGEVTVDDRLHVNQLSSSECDIEKSYMEYLFEVDHAVMASRQSTTMKGETGLFSSQADTNNQPSALYRDKAAAADQKLDIVLTLAQQYASDDEEVCLIFCDDRFFNEGEVLSDEEDSESAPVSTLHSLTRFLDLNRHYIPANVLLKFYKCDPYHITSVLDQYSQAEKIFLLEVLPELEKAEHDKLLANVIQHAYGHEARSLCSQARSKTALEVLTKAINESMLVCYKENIQLADEYLRKELTKTNSRYHQRFLTIRYHDRMSQWDNLSEDKRQVQLTEMFHIICEMQGTARGDALNHDGVKGFQFWSEVLLPAAQQFTQFLSADHEEISTPSLGQKA